MLNFLSFFGLIMMVGLAWLMSSHRWKVNWRLVLVGIGLQLLLGAVLFNSQTWTTYRHFESFDELATALKEKEINLKQVDAAIANTADGRIHVGEMQHLAYGSIQKDLDAKKISLDAVEQSWPEDALYIPDLPGGILFTVFDTFFGYIKKWTDEGAAFVFGFPPGQTGNPGSPLLLLTTFAFGVLPTVIFFAALMSVLYHIGVMEVIVKAMAWFMQKLLGTSGAESLAAAANVFVGHTEAPLVVKPYIAGMTRSELNAMMVGGFATITGGLMAVFVARGISAGHLVTASLVSAPAALVIAKILQPETESPETLGNVKVSFEKRSSNVVEAAATGASDGMKLAINIAAMLIAFLALIALVDTLIFALGEILQSLTNMVSKDKWEYDWSLKGLFSILFWPLAWVMGIQTNDCRIAGELLGTKMVVNEFLAYMDLGSYMSGAVKNPDTKEVVRISRRSEIILTYALCGFSNFGAIGIQIGGIGPLAPDRRADIAQLGLRAMLGGMLACCMTACIAGIFYGVLS